eukprot:TRINITY_DN32310_c0_g1_i1.p1 TRINITY_DN32310_c0_g1~~TRINITY_DN32310_c0_g1_i1.p1  ORF type:complete len:911 (+),score=98.52 TRINITY_DN32310_c0_g1_i1:401-3133(+)
MNPQTDPRTSWGAWSTHVPRMAAFVLLTFLLGYLLNLSGSTNVSDSAFFKNFRDRAPALVSSERESAATVDEGIPVSTERLQSHGNETEGSRGQDVETDERGVKGRSFQTPLILNETVGGERGHGDEITEKMGVGEEVIPPLHASFNEFSSLDVLISGEDRKNEGNEKARSERIEFVQNQHEGGGNGQGGRDVTTPGDNENGTWLETHGLPALNLSNDTFDKDTLSDTPDEVMLNATSGDVEQREPSSKGMFREGKSKDIVGEDAPNDLSNKEMKIDTPDEGASNEGKPSDLHDEVALSPEASPRVDPFVAFPLPELSSPVAPLEGAGSASQKKEPLLAVCLVGGARDLELTVLSLKKHLLSAYANSHVFVNVPFDEKTHKVSLFADVPNLVKLRVVTASPLPEPDPAKRMMNGKTAPNGLQGLLHYFMLVEGCVEIIAQQEAKYPQNGRYEWILRTRVDTYWTGPPPSLHSIDPRTYAVPVGSRWAGLNDRFGLGTRDLSEIALKRFSMLSELQAANYTGFNSEKAFAAQLNIRRVPSVSLSLPFCVLSRRRYGTARSGNKYTVPMFSMFSSGEQSGAKCRPCAPAVAEGPEAEEIVGALMETHGWPGRNKGLAICDSNVDWENGWEMLYDRGAGPENAKIRQSFTLRKLDRCLREYHQLESLKRDVYEGPPSSLVCLTAHWGELKHLYAGSASKKVAPTWFIFSTPPLNKSSVVYLIGGMVSELEAGVKITKSVGPKIHVFSPAYFSPSANFSKENLASLKRFIVIHPWKVGVSIKGVKSNRCPIDGVWRNGKPDDSSQPRFKCSTTPSGPIESLLASVKKTKSKKVDLLMIEIGNLGLRELAKLLRGVRCCQLAVRFSSTSQHDLEEQLQGSGVKALRDNSGFVLFKCDGSVARPVCLFLHQTFCTK